MNEMALICWYCPFRTRDNKSLIQHLKDALSFEPGFRIECGICGQSFRVFSSYTSHVSRKHPGIAADSCCVFNDSSDQNQCESMVTETQAQESSTIAVAQASTPSHPVIAIHISSCKDLLLLSSLL